MAESGSRLPQSGDFGNLAQMRIYFWPSPLGGFPEDHGNGGGLGKDAAKNGVRKNGVSVQILTKCLSNLRFPSITGKMGSEKWYQVFHLNIFRWSAWRRIVQKQSWDAKQVSQLIGGLPCKPRPPVRFSRPFKGSAAHGRHCLRSQAFCVSCVRQATACRGPHPPRV